MSTGFAAGRALRPTTKVLPEHARGHNRSLVLQTLYCDQVSAIIVIVGAELNRGIVEVKRRLAIAEDLNAELSTVPMPPSHGSYRVEN